MSPALIIKKVTNIIRSYFGNDVEIFLFGSWAKGKAKPNSDIDFAVRVISKEKNKDKKFLRIREDLEGLRTLRKIDIVNLEYTSPEFRKHIFKYAVPL